MGDTRTVNGVAGVEDKFGRVFIRVPDTSKKHEYQLVEGLRFSNLQLRVLDADAEDVTYAGRSYSLDFFGNRLRVPILLGTNKIADTKNVHQAYEKEVSIAKELKLINEQDGPEDYSRKCELVRNSRMSLFWTLASPCMDIMEQNFLLEAAPILYMDDLLESLCSSGNDSGKTDKKQKLKMPYRFTSRMSYVLAQCFQASENEKEDPLGELLGNPSKLFKKLSLGDKDNKIAEIMQQSPERVAELFTLIRCILKVVSRIRMVAHDTGKTNGCSSSGFLEKIAMAMDIFFLEVSEEWFAEITDTLGQNNSVMSPSIVNLRKCTAAGMIFVEINLLQNGIQLVDEVRTCAVFRLIADQIETHFQKVNELVSFEKEMHGDVEEWRNNEACVLHKLDGLMKQYAKAKMTDEANKALEQIERLTGLLLSIWKGREQEDNIVGFVRIVWQTITGFMQWVALIDRYYNDLTLDCYID